MTVMKQQFSVGQAFNLAARSKASHPKMLLQLTGLRNTYPEGFLDAFLTCFRRIMVVSKVRKFVEMMFGG